MLTEKEKTALQREILSNQHEIYVILFEEIDAIIRSSHKGNKPSVKTAWAKIKDAAGVGASYYASADDVVTATKLVGIGMSMLLEYADSKLGITNRIIAGLDELIEFYISCFSS